MAIFGKKPSKNTQQLSSPGTQGSPTLTPIQDPLPTQPRPRVLLIDIDDAIAGRLRSSGINISTGTFGSPWAVKQGANHVPVRPKSQFPDNYTEQEIVIIDIEGPTPTSSYEEAGPFDDIQQYWASCKYGFIDPRPLAMILLREKFDRILNHGGVFIVFAVSREMAEYGLGKSLYGDLRISEKLQPTSWDFLSILGAVGTKADSGSDIQSERAPASFASALRRYYQGGKFSCTLTPDRYGPYIPTIDAKSWLSLATNRYDSTVSALVLPNEDRKGLVIILPSIGNRAELLHEMLTNTLPELLPTVFPSRDQGAWVHRDEYESSNVIAINRRIEEIKKETERQINECEKLREEEKNKYRFMYDLLRSSGQNLVLAVKSALEIAGFSTVVDMDTEKAQLGKKAKLDEDLQIREPGKPLLLIEVKGLTRLAPDAESLQAWKYIAPRMKELQRFDIRALAVINHQRNTPPFERDNDNVFRQEIIDNAEKHDFGLMTTWDLFRLIKNMQENKWPSDWVKPIFYRGGRICPLPHTYEQVGIVERYLDKIGVVSIRINAGELCTGDWIGLIRPVKVHEQQIRSMQKNGLKCDRATVGDLVGVKCIFSEDEIKIGTSVWRIKGKVIDS